MSSEHLKIVSQIDEVLADLEDDAEAGKLRRLLGRIRLLLLAADAAKRQGY